jgi:ribosome-associated protein
MNADLLETLLKGKLLSFEFYRASGPGGQNVNKVSTAVRLRFDVAASLLLPEAAKTRLAQLAGRKLTEAGVLLIEAQRFRTQERNREDALRRLGNLLQRAMEEPSERIPTQPTAASKKRRIEFKLRNAVVKRARRVAKNWDSSSE